MDLTSRLLIFLEVVELGSFAKVAERRNIDRSVVSKQVNKLEQSLGVRLLNRSTRSFSLTAAGAEMVKKAQEMRFILSETEQIAENFHTEPKGLLRLTSSSILGKRYIQPVINEFQKAYPEVDIELRLEDRLVDIISEGYDLAFRVGPQKDSNLISRPLAPIRILIAASPEFIKTYGEPATMQDLAKLPAATYAGETKRMVEMPYITDKGEETSINMRCVFQANDGELILSKALSGTAYAPVPAFVIDQEVLKGELVPIMQHVKLPDYYSINAVYPHRGLPVRSQLFLDAVMDYIGRDKPVWEKNIPNFDKMYGYSRVC
ncbi:LysR family transcriptional regulator [Catenovulum sp. 2E275]|uniref:LysR family transcriptional regulator n=1 Tax=Catenovulum sp. 2E275 TaxID=2980497 RepID=UPI0021CF9258|nr:LysR family transcriptional regulator [Catenovulum sp. 2E275]MCU4675120.1 LysR family transcriptional regulator [Catenovulum sp. 2E275]